MRKPNLKKSIKARTTGKLKRSVKRSINPLYGKKGMGLVNNPKKAMYNKVYNKTTFGMGDISKGSNYSYEAPEIVEMSLQDLVDAGRFDTLKELNKKYRWKIISCTIFGFVCIVPWFYIPKNIKLYLGTKQALEEENRS